MIAVKGALHAKQSNTALSARQFTGACFLALVGLAGPEFLVFAMSVVTILGPLVPSAPSASAPVVLSADSFGLIPLVAFAIGESPGSTIGSFARKDAVSFPIYLQSNVIRAFASGIIDTDASQIAGA